MKKPPRSLRPFATVAAGLLALVACQNATDSNTNSDSPVVAAGQFPISAPRIPDSAAWIFQKDTVAKNPTCPADSKDSAITCTETFDLPQPLGKDSVALQLWTLGVQTYTVYFKESGSSTTLSFGSASVQSLDTLLLSRFADLSATVRSSFGSGPSGLVAYYASLILAKDAAVVGQALPAGMSLDSVKKEIVRLGADSGKTLLQLTSLNIHLGSTTLTLDSLTVQADISILIQAKMVPASDSTALFPPYPVQVSTPIAVSGPVVAGGSPVAVTGSFSWTAGKIVTPNFEVHNAKGVDTNFTIPITNPPSTSATTWNLANSVTLQAKSTASAGTDTLVATLSCDSGRSATSRTLFQVVQNASIPTFSPNGGTFYGPQNVAITASGSDSIQISTDSTTWSKYTSAVSVSTSEKLYARSFAGGVISPVGLATFFIGSVPVPSITPNGGSFYGADTVTVSASGSDSIQISTDSSYWTKYTGKFIVTSTEKLYARGFKGGVTSAVTSASFTSSAVPVPTIAPNGGTFYSTQSVAVTAPAGTDSIQVSTDSSTWNKYTQKISVSSSGKLYARSFTGGVASPTVSASFTIGSVPVPSISPNGGTFYSSQSVTVSAAGSDSVQISTDSTIWTLYTIPVSVSGSERLFARSFKGGVASSVASATFSIGSVSIPSISPNGGTFYSSQSVTVSAAGSDSIQISTDSASWGKYTSAISVTSSEKLYARSFKGGVASSVASATFSIGGVSIPSISPNGGTFYSSQSVTVSAAGSDSIQISTDSTTWSKYTAAVSVTASEKLYGRSFKGGVASSVASATFSIGSVSIPNISPNGGTFYSSQSVTVSATGSDSIQISTDSTTWSKYTAAVSVTSSEKLYARSFKGGVASSVASAPFIIGTIPLPSISPNGGSFYGSTTVTVSATGSDSIQISTDSTTWNKYTSALTVTASEKLYARSFKGGVASSVMSASFISSAIPVPTLSPNGGTFYSSQAVTVTGPTGTDSVQTSKDSTTWTRYTQAISITASGKLYARSFAGGVASPVVWASFVIGTVPVPGISPNGGTIYTTQNVTVTASGTDSIQTSTDSATWTKYTASVPVYSSGKLYARAFKGGVASTVASATFTLATVPAPGLSPNGATFNPTDSVTVTATSADSIEYSTDSANWHTYSAKVVLSATGKLYARAFKSGGVSTVVSATFTKDVVPPTIVPSAGTISRAVVYDTTSVTLTWTVSDNYKMGSIALNGAPIPLTSSVVEKMPLVVGINSFVLVATDTFGNTARDSFVITRGGDITPPVIVRNSGTSNQTLPNATTSYTVSWTVTDNVKMGAVTIGGTTITPATGGVYSSTINLTVGTRKVGIVALDSAGNKSTDTVVLARSALAPTHSAVAGNYIGTVYDTLKSSGADSLEYSTNGSVWLPYLGAAAIQGTGQITIYARAFPGGVKDSVQVTLSQIKMLAAGSYSSLFLKTDGSVWASGQNSAGQFANGSTTQIITPTLMVNNMSSIAIGGVGYYTETDGRLWAAGSNYYGQLGIGSTSNASPLTYVMPNVKTSSIGGEFGLFVKTDGTLWGTGDNWYGELGTGNQISDSTPIQIMSGVSSVATGFYHSLIVGTDGTLWGTGDNSDGQLGIGNTVSTFTPTQVTTNVASVSAGRLTSLILKKDGTVWAAGLNSSGQHGTGRTNIDSIPVQVMSGVVAISASDDFSLFLKSDGTLWATGNNGTGQFGNGTTTSSTVPVEIMSNVSAIAAGSTFSLILKKDGTLWATGDDLYGQLGNGQGPGYTGPGSSFYFTSPVRINF